MSEVKQVKVDNWGIYFLQKLKHFFNRTDYCDLTLQFQNNAQLKVHRLVLNACTEYFELLERTCEMYEDCLVMPDDLQADVVVPIVNFMYTGHLEFRIDLLERLYQTSQILNMPVLTKLLESHRMAHKTSPQSYSAAKRFTKPSEPNKLVKSTVSNKRSYSKAFDNNLQSREKKFYQPLKHNDSDARSSTYTAPTPVPIEPVIQNNKLALSDPKPTRYELPEELDQDNVFDNSFCNISYTSKPLMVHPDTVKRYSAKRTGIFSEASGSKKMISTMDVVECKRISKESNIFDDNVSDHVNDDLDIFQASYNNDTVKSSSNLFDQILDDTPKVTIDTKDSKVASNLDHAKIISEVLKKYPHLVKSNKNIKLKILSTPNSTSKAKKITQKTSAFVEDKQKLKTEEPDYTYETDVIDSQQAAKLIAMGAENTKGPWICLICGTPGKALHFSSYYKFRRHLVEVHNEKPVSNICEYCGLKSLKRNNLLHHLYAQHGQPPPPPFKFPKCNRCSYIALTEGLLVKHKMTHKEIKNFRCNVCASQFATTKQLLEHIQATGHKYSAERKTNLQCIYCLKTFLRDGNLYAHLKTYHKKEAKCDGVIEDSDDEKTTVETPRMKMDTRESKYHTIKCEPSTSSYENEYEVDVQYQIQQGQDGDIQLTPTKQHKVITTPQHRVITNMKQKILNPGFGTSKPIIQKGKPVMKSQPEPSPFLDEISIPLSPVSNDHSEEEIVLIDNTEYIMRDNQLIPRKLKSGSNEYIIADMMEPASLQQVQPTTSSEYTNIHNTSIIEETAPRMLAKKATNINQPIQIVVSNEEEYKALMTSNHPILFDHGDASKTLTVLTAQHNPTIQSTSIDLNNTPSNNMMIIQEDYPMNVSETISADNSNIVVVYSHPVDDQNKQYQILTTGGIGSQFVESSAIITQNYETVTTSTPVTSVHGLPPQVETMWQSNVQNVNSQEIPVQSHSELHNVLQAAEIAPASNMNSDNLSELPEVHLLSEQDANISHENQVVDASSEINVGNPELVSQSVEQEILEDSQSIPNSQIETHVLREVNMGEAATNIPTPLDISTENESISESLTNNSNQNTVMHLPMAHIVAAEDNSMAEEKQTETAEGPTQTAEEHTHPPIEQTEDSSEYTQTAGVTQFVSEEQVDDGIGAEISEVVENGNNVEQPLPESQAYDDIVQNNNETKAISTSYTKKTDEKIQNLTSEWSEDEYEIPEDPTNEESISKPKDVTAPIPEQLEETIENIRKEMQNHITSTPTVIAPTEPAHESETDSRGDSILVDTLTGQISETTESNEPVAVKQNEQAQEKISSLLNDWDDNESQEDNNSGDVPAIENEQVGDVPATENENVSDVTIEKVSKIDNIKNLVSDWEEEEEIKINND